MRRQALWVMAMGCCAAILVSVAPDAQGGSATPITSCGQVVTTNAFLTGDLYCPGSDGVVVGASGITIDLKGHWLRGNSGSATNGVESVGFQKVTVKNGKVRNFDVGVYLSAADGSSVSNIFSTGNPGQGIYLTGDSLSVKSSTTWGNGGSGVQVFGDGATIKSVSASANSIGIYINVGDSARIQSSTASGNLAYGIFVAGDAPVIKGNRAEANGFINGTSDFFGHGIRVQNYTTPPVGKNMSLGNDNLAECDPAYLC